MNATVRFLIVIEVVESQLLRTLKVYIYCTEILHITRLDTTNVVEKQEELGIANRCIIHTRLGIFVFTIHIKPQL